MSETTIDQIREELRGALWGSAFGISIQSVQSTDKSDADAKRQQVCAFAYFGANARLISQEEANEWMDVAWGRKTLLDVAKKWEGDK